ncbi:MAG: HDOD domain-containing protein [Zoogloeaceae bacterium]|nr:HDOD domain-containing protein [Zoogloeaceae bacterium]
MMTKPDSKHLAASNQCFAPLGEHSGAHALRRMLAHYRPRQHGTKPESAPDTSRDAPLVPPAHPLLDAARVQEAIARMPDLPPLIAELLEGFTHAERLNISVVTQRLSTDQGLVLRILRIANSSFYGLSGQVKSLDDAIQILGLRTVYTLALNVVMMGALPQPPCAGFNLHYFWQHSVAVAITTRELTGLHHQTPDAAFTNGLLHDIGQIILALCFPDEYRIMLDYESAHSTARYLVERAVLGIDHAQTGAMLARQWGLPEELSAVIAGHHAPPEDGSADTAHLADVLAHALDRGPSGNFSIPRLDEGAWTRLKLDEKHLFPVLTRLESSFEETCKALLRD